MWLPMLTLLASMDTCKIMGQKSWVRAYMERPFVHVMYTRKPYDNQKWGGHILRSLQYLS